MVHFRLIADYCYADNGLVNCVAELGGVANGVEAGPIAEMRQETVSSDGEKRHDCRMPKLVADFSVATTADDYLAVVDFAKNCRDCLPNDLEVDF